MNIQYEYKGSSIEVSLAGGLSSLVHFHRHIELIYMLEGEATAYCDFREYRLEAGDFFLAFPNQIHYYQNTRPLRAILIILPVDFFTDYSQVLLSKVPESSVMHGVPEHTELAGLIKALYETAVSVNPYKKEIMRGYACALMGVCLSRLSLCKSQNDITDSLHSILTFCERNYKSDISLDSLSDQLHLSKYYISRIFNRKIKISFSDFINQLRIDEACHLLVNTEAPITDIAYEVGFGSIRSFNRAFEKFMGCNPRDYQKKFSHSV